MDPAGSVVAGAEVELQNALTSFQTVAITDTSGEFRIINVPLNPYSLQVRAMGFLTYQQAVTVQSGIPVRVEVVLRIAGKPEQVEVQSELSLVEDSPVSHTDLGRDLLQRLPIVTGTSPLSSLLTLSVPGLIADSNGQLDPMAEEGDTTFMVDNQPIADRQGRIFSDQLPPNTIQAVQVIQGVPPAEYGDKTGMIVRTQTQSGLALNKPTGSVVGSYGSFGTSTASVTLGVGNEELGNFFAASALQTGRFLDTPEFRPLHDLGNAESFFDALDWRLSRKDTLHLNLGGSRSWFQVPNTYDQAFSGQDQRQKLEAFNVAPGYSHLFNASTLLSANAWVRQQRVNYYPSANPFSDQPATLEQTRRMTNAGIRSDVSYVRGKHNIKAGFQFQYTALSEAFQLGITNPLFNAVCEDANDLPVVAPGITDPANCTAAGFEPNEEFQAGLLPFDLTRGGQLFRFRGNGAIRQEAAYAQDTINVGNLSATLGLRADNYDGLSSSSALEPRVGLSYQIARTQTVLRGSYGRLFETPYTENLVIASSTGAGGLNPSTASDPLVPGIRNQFDVGLQQAIGRHLVIDADYEWKFTRRAYDSDALLETPLIFPTQFRKAKIDGVTVRVALPNYRGWSGFAALGHVRARFFGPEIGGLLFENEQSNAPFRIDQDQNFQQTTHLQYQFGKRGPWLGTTWRYDSGVVNASVPDFATALTLTADQQAAVGLFCGNVFATLASPIRTCSSSVFGATRLYIPAAGTANPDLNPPRVASRHLFDVTAGMDNIFKTDRYRVGLRFTVLNLTNKVAFYNFLSEFSGTHFVTPRMFEVQTGFSF